MAASTERESRTILTAQDQTAGAFASFQRSIAQAQAGITSMTGMLTGLAGGAVIGGLATLVKHSLEQADAMNKMAQKTGVATAELSKLAYAANLSDVSNEQLTKGFKGLSEQMAKAADGSSYTAALFTKMGVDLKAGTGPALEKIADVFKSLPDGATKTALAVELFGKAGQDMIPLLNQGAAGMAAMKDEAEQLGLVISGETAEAAEKFNDNMKAMATGAEKTGLALVTRLAASLASVSEAMKEAYKDSGMLMAAWVGLGGVAAKIFTDDSLSDIEKTQKRMSELRTELVNLKQRMEDAQGVMGPWGETLRKSLVEAAMKGTKEMQSLNAELIAFLNNQNAAEEARKKADADKKAKEDEFAKLKAQEDARKKSEAEIAAWNKKLRDEDLKGWVAYADAVFNEADQNNLAMAKINADYWAGVEKLREADTAGWVKAYEEREDEAIRFGQLTLKALNKQKDEEAKVQEAAAREQAAIFDDLAGIGGRYFSDLIVSGKSAFDNLKQMLKSFAADLIALFAKRYLLNLAVGGGALVGSTAANAATGGGTSALGSLGTLLSGGAGFGSLAGMGGGALTGGTLGAIGNGASVFGSSLMAGNGTGMMAGASQVLAAAGPYIAFAAVAYGLYQAFKGKSGGPKEGGSYQGMFNDIGALNNGSSPGWYGVNSQNANVQQLVGATGLTLAQSIARYGGTTSGFSIGLGYDADPRGTANSRLTSSLTDASGKTLFGHSGMDIGRGDEGAALSLEMSRLIVEGLKASNISEEIKKLFEGFTGDTQEAFDALFASAEDLNGALTQLANVTISGLTVDALKKMQLAGESLNQTAARVTGTFAGLQDLFSTDAEKQARDMQSISDAFKSINVAVPDSIAGFKALIDSLDLSTDSGRALYDVLVATGPKFKQIQDNMTGLVAGVGEAINTVISNVPAGYNPFVTGPIMSDNPIVPARSSLAAYLTGSLTSAGSPLSPMAQYAEAKRQYEANLAAARGGDVNAISNFGQYRDSFLNASRSVYASSGQYNTDFFGSYNAGAALTGGAVGPYTVAAGQANTQSIIAALGAQSAASIEALDAATAATNALLARIADNTARPAVPGALTPTTL